MILKHAVRWKNSNKRERDVNNPFPLTVISPQKILLIDKPYVLGYNLRCHEEK